MLSGMFMQQRLHTPDSLPPGAETKPARREVIMLKKNAIDSKTNNTTPQLTSPCFSKN
jgi:hypothetical protein